MIVYGWWVVLQLLGPVANAEVARAALSEKAWTPADELALEHERPVLKNSEAPPRWRLRLSSWVPMDYVPSVVPGLSVAHVRPLGLGWPDGWDAIVDLQWRWLEKNDRGATGTVGTSMLRGELGLQRRWAPLTPSLEWVMGGGLGPVWESSQSSALGWIVHGEFSICLKRVSGRPQVGGQVSVGRLGSSRLEGFGLHVGISL